MQLAALDAALLDPWRRYRERRIRERREAAEREQALRRAAEDDDDEAAMLSVGTGRSGSGRGSRGTTGRPGVRKKTGRPARPVHRNATAVSDRPAGEHTTRCSGQLPASRDLSTWASELAAALPPLTEPQVAAVARLAAHLDASASQKSAA